MATGFVGLLNEGGAGFVEGFGAGAGAAEDGLDLVVGELAGEAVGAEEVEVAGLDGGFDEVCGDAGLRTEGAGDDVAKGAACGFGAGHTAESDLLFDEGVVLSAEFELAAAEAVTAAVADVDDPEAGVVIDIGKDADEGGAHAAEAGVALSAGVDGIVRGLDGLFGDGGECGGWVAWDAQGEAFCDALGDQAENLIDGERAGDFTGSGTAHAVAYDVDAMFDGVSESIFIGRTLAATIGNSGGGMAQNGGGQRSLPESKFTTR